jgi:hypothetical protein
MFLLYRKIVSLLFLLVCMHSLGHAQLLKRLKEEAKWKAEQILRQKAYQVIDKAVDSIGTKKEKNQRASEQSNTNESATVKVTDAANFSERSNKKPDTEQLPGKNNKENNQEGFIELDDFITTVFIGGQLLFTGKSAYYEGYNKVYIQISDEKNYLLNVDLLLDKNGLFAGQWYAPNIAGRYTITAVSSNKKATATKEIEVVDFFELDEMAEENITQINKAVKLVEERSEKVKGMISSQQAAELDKKIKLLKEKSDAATGLFKSINNANKKLAAMVTKGKVLPGNLSENLSELNVQLKNQSDEMAKAQQEFSNHQPLDNTICEYLVMINEACALFSTVTGFWAKSIGGIVKNIVLDKASGIAVDAAKKIGSVNTPNGADMALKEPGKLYLAASVDAESLVGKLGTAQFAGDMLSFVTDVLLKMYCGMYSGEMTQTFNFTYKNKAGTPWWKYGGELKANLSLRYPKNAATGKIIKMKGGLEGNATKFNFWADPKEAVADELKSAYNSTKVITIADYKPPTFPFVSSQEDKAGFGAVARGIATPASFYIPVDAEYDLDSKQIKIFINEAILDFTPLVKHRKMFVVIAVLPLFRVEDFPIEKAQKIIRGSFKEKNWFTIAGEETGKPHFGGTITRKVNQPDFTIDLSITMKAEKD